MTSDRQEQKSGLSPGTLAIASLSSLAAALVVSRIWGGGTLIGAAMTPVIVAVVSEGLRRPATVITTVRETRSSRYDPIAEGRAGLHEGDLERARSAVPAAAVAERRVHRASGRSVGGGGFSLRMPKPRVIAAVMTGLVAFAIAGILLTSSELVLGKSVVSSSKRTTFVPVKRNASSTGTTTTEKTTSTQNTTSTTTTTAPEATTPPSTETTPTAPPTQTAPPTTTAPAPQSATPPPAATPTTPAPQSATPPATTTP